MPYGGKTMGAIATSVRDRLDESTAAFWTDAQLRRWINEGARDIARRTQSILERADIAITGGTQEYLLPSDVIRINRVEFTRTGDSQVFALEYADFQNMDQVWYTQQKVTQNSTPGFYTLWGWPPNLKLVLYPTPSNNGSCKIFYYRLPTEIATDGTGDAVVIDIPSGWEDLIVDFVEFNALRKDSDPRWQEAKALYDERLEAMYENTLRWTDSAGMVTTDSGMGYVPSWLWNEGF